MKHHAPILSEREEQLLQAIYLYKYLTLAQLTRLFFSAGAKNHAGAYLTKLYRQNLLYRFPLPTTTKGNREYIYTLAHKGMRHLTSLGRDLEHHFTPSNEPPSYLHLQHTLACNDLLIAGAQLANTPEIHLRSLRTEWMLKHSPISVHLPATPTQGKETITVISDGLLDFHFWVKGITYQTTIWVELDCGTEEQKQFRRKVAGLHAAITSEVCKQQFDTQSLIVAFATTAGEKRCTTMRQWIEHELTQLQYTQDADLFFLTTLPAGTCDPEHLFLAPIWAIPLQSSLVPLIDLS